MDESLSFGDELISYIISLVYYRLLNVTLEANKSGEPISEILYWKKERKHVVLSSLALDTCNNSFKSGIMCKTKKEIC